jgi:MtN3 and saliva related transmembrane protein
LHSGNSAIHQHRPTVNGIETLIGAIAGICTTLCNVPQVWKCWTTGETADISFKMLLLLGGGLILWAVYGTLKGDAVIVSANTVSLGLVLILLYFKIRNMGTKREAHGDRE